jgi:hypothetical protein
MKASELVKKLRSKLLGKKSDTSAAGDTATVIQIAPAQTTIVSPVLDLLGVIQLHEHWRN